MKKLFVLTAILLSAVSFAGEKHEVLTGTLGLQLGPDGIGALKEYAKSKGKRTHRLVSGSVEIKSIAIKGEDVESLSVAFTIRNLQVKSTKAVDGAYLFCEAKLVPEEQESDPSDILYKVTEAGCEV